jgi:hypothetical protein
LRATSVPFDFAQDGLLVAWQSPRSAKPQKRGDCFGKNALAMTLIRKIKIHLYEGVVR